jgi:hypothetical protein
MKSSLEDERRALLEHIEASRAVYRRMLSDASPPRVVRHGQPADTVLRHTEASAGGRALSWMKAHPLWVAAGMTLIVLLVSRSKVSGKRATHATSLPQREPSSPSGTLRALLTVAALLLREPSRVRTTTRMLKSAWQWLRTV